MDTPSVAAPDLALAVPDTFIEQSSQWFADEPPAVAQLARQTLTVLAQASPQRANVSSSPPSKANSMAWLPTAFETLQRLPAELTPPANVRAWKYLVFTRVLCDALEAAYAAALAQHTPLSCPLTPPDATPSTQNRVRPRSAQVEMIASGGLGSLIAGQKLPSEGRARIAEACAAGIDWCHSEVFWAACTPPASNQETIPTPDREAQAVSSLSLSASRQNPINTPPSSPQQHQSPVRKSLPSAKPVSAAAQYPPPSPDTTHRLTQAVVKGVLALTTSTTFNRCGGDGWLVGDTLWVVAKTLAQQLQQQDLIGEQPHLLACRETLYRALLNHGVVMPNGERPIWKILVDEDTQHQRATVLKLPATLIWPQQTERPSEFSGTIQPAQRKRLSDRDSGKPLVEPSTLFDLHR